MQVDFTGVANRNPCNLCESYYSASFYLSRNSENVCNYYFLDEWTCNSPPVCTGGEVTWTHITADFVYEAGTYLLRIDVNECRCCSSGVSVEVLVARFEYDFGTIPACIIDPPIELTPAITGTWSPWGACTWDDEVVTCTVQTP